MNPHTSAREAAAGSSVPCSISQLAACAVPAEAIASVQAALISACLNCSFSPICCSFLDVVSKPDRAVALQKSRMVSGFDVDVALLDQFADADDAARHDLDSRIELWLFAKLLRHALEGVAARGEFHATLGQRLDALGVDVLGKHQAQTR